MNRKQTFADLGCGNGLLTFLLVEEGYEGFGVDIADRKIWTKLCKDNKDDMLRGKHLLIITNLSNLLLTLFYQWKYYIHPK